MEGMTLEKLQVIIEAYTKPYRDELEKVKKQTTATTSHVERQTSKMASSFKKIVGVVAAALSITALLAFGKSCIQLGSDLAEVQNVVDVTFGSMSKQVNAFSKNAITQFGLSELTAKKYMGTYGAMAKSFGIAGEAGYQMSAAITGLTGDVASFYNLSTDEAYTKLKSIFTGETESLKELGVVMTQTALDQYAVNNGFGKTTAKMTEQEKVMLRYRFVMSSLADASGDFSRTSTSWANQTRVLALQFESLKATIGQGLINAFTPVIQVINTVLAKLQTLASYFKAFTASLFGDAGGSSSVSDTMDSAAGSSGTVADNLGKAADAAKKLKDYTLGIDELNVLNPDDGDSTGGGSGGSGGSGGVPDFGNMTGELFSDVTVNPAVEEAAKKVKDLLEAIKTAAEPTREVLKRLWDEGLAKLGNFVWTGLKDFWNEFLVPLGKWTLGTGIPMFVDAINNFLLKVNWQAINEALKNFWKALEPFAEKVGEGLLKFFYDLLDIGARFISVVVPGGLNGIATALNTIDPERAEQIGYALGVIATSLAALTIVGTVAAGFEKLGEAIRKFPGYKTIAGLFGSGGLFVGLQNLVKGMGGPGTASFDVIAVWIMEGINDASIKLLPDWANKFLGNLLVGIVSGGLVGSAVPVLGTIAGMIVGGILGALNYALDGAKILKTIGEKIFNWNDTKEIFNYAYENFKQAFSGNGKWYEIGANIIEGIVNGFIGTFVFFLEPIHDLLTWIVQSLCDVLGIHSPAESMKPYGGYILLGIIEGFKDTFGEWTESLNAWYSNYIAPWFTAQKWSELYKTIKEQLKNTWDETVGVWATDISVWWSQNVSPWFTIQKWNNLYDAVKTQLKQKWTDTSNAWKTDIDSWWTNDVSPWFTVQKWLDLYETIKTGLKTKWDETVGNWRIDLSGWWTNDVSPWFTLEKWKGILSKIPEAFKTIFKDAAKAAIGVLNNFIDKVNDIFSFDWEWENPITGEEHSGNITLFRIPKISVPEFANGGVINSGQLFVANEKGPELVGKYGSRSGVMNNKQIVDAVSDGVAIAVANVMTAFQDSGSDEPANINLVVDGRTLATVQTNTLKRSGYNFRTTRTV